MCTYGAAEIVKNLPVQAEYIATVAVGPEERYRVHRWERKLLAVHITPLCTRSKPEH